MKNRAKAAGQGRHGLNSISGMLVGAGIASSQEIEAVRVLLESMGLPSELMAVVGLLGLALSHFMSWKSRAKLRGEGDPE